MARSLSRAAALAGASGLLTLLLLAAVDRLLPWFLRQPPPGPSGLFFPPGSSWTFRTSEFEFTTAVNSLGFRDREFELRPPHPYRILAIGDSYTYGWGVDLNQSWVKVLERRLSRNGHPVEIADLGRPGDYPEKYANIAERMIPVLRPDLVLIAVLQGDDLAQGQASLRARSWHRPTVSSLRARVRQVLAIAYPHLLAYLSSPNARVDLTWQDEVRQLLGSASKEQIHRFSRLEEPVKQAYLYGDLNPSLLQSALEDPDYYWKTLDLGKSATRGLIHEMAAQLARAKAAARRFGVPVYVVSVPHRAYSSKDGWLALERLGYHVEPAMLGSPAPDQAIRQACDEAGLPFLEVTADFRRRATEAKLFFDLDGHFNESGHQVFGDLLVSRLAAQFPPLR